MTNLSTAATSKTHQKELRIKISKRASFRVKAIQEDSTMASVKCESQNINPEQVISLNVYLSATSPSFLIYFRLFSLLLFSSSLSVLVALSILPQNSQPNQRPTD